MKYIYIYIDQEGSHESLLEARIISFEYHEMALTMIRKHRIYDKFI